MNEIETIYSAKTASLAAQPTSKVSRRGKITSFKDVIGQCKIEKYSSPQEIELIKDKMKEAESTFTDFMEIRKEIKKKLDCFKKN